MALLTMWASKAVISRCLLQLRHMSPAVSLHTSPVQSDSNRTSVVRISRQKYERLYPVLLVQPDGSTINIRYREPRRILMMPVDLSTLSEEERKARMKKRDPKRGAAKRKEAWFDDDFKADDYSQFWKKK
ncbi:large ribosomal subunit protein mL55 [Osmerus mordax]|uniref:large ribosomal subunit protein mL55 n=1 Tax=Osmerus mordax TaxID=8014 RepID=UPI0035106673